MMNNFANQMTDAEIDLGDWTLLSEDQMTGNKTYGMQLSNGNVALRVVGDVSAILSENQAAQSAALGQPLQDVQRVASIPSTMWYGNLEEAHREGDHKYINTFLNDSDNCKLRTNGERL